MCVRGPERGKEGVPGGIGMRRASKEEGRGWREVWDGELGKKVVCTCVAFCKGWAPKARYLCTALGMRQRSCRN